MITVTPLHTIVLLNYQKRFELLKKNVSLQK